MYEYIYFPTLPIVKVHLIINCVLALLTVLVVCLRLVARFLSGAGLWWDDYLILFALPQGLGMVIIQGLWTPMGVGYHVTETLPNLETMLKMLVAYELIYSTTISTIKISVLMFYMRVFVNRSLRIATKAALVFVMLWSTGNILQVFLICRPFPKTYSLTVEGVCGDQKGSFIAIGAFNVITDVIILTLPLPTVWSLKMSTPAKLGLTGVFLVGLIVSVIAIIRIITLTQLDLMDLTATMIWADFWSATEPNLAILCVSLPMLGTLWSRCVGTHRRGGTSKYGYHTSSSNGGGTSISASAAAGFSKLKNQSQVTHSRAAAGDADESDRDRPDQIPLENLYAANQTVHYQTAVITGVPATPDAGSVLAGETESIHKDSGSEVSLTERGHHHRGHTRQDHSGNGGGIRVQTKWTISRD